MRQYLEMLQHVLTHGVEKPNRTGVNTLAVFGYQMRVDLADGFPLLTTKRMFFRGIIEELLWFLRGSTDNSELKAKGVNIWTAWERPDGDLGPIYGKQWRRWPTDPFSIPSYIDQIAQLVEGIKTTAKDPTASVGRRLIVSAWNVADIPRMALAPCHCLVQFDVTNGRLSCQLYQRSADLFLGVPFNIASYALLTHMLAQVCDLEPGDFIHTFGDLHIYVNHLDQVRTQLTREPYPLPVLRLNPQVKNIDAFKAEDFSFDGYNWHPALKGDVAV